MLYWFRKWEEECNYKLFMPSEQGKVFCEILVEGLLRGKTLSRYQAYNIGRNAGFLCVDDIREKENMNSLPDGKGQIFLEPLNMKPAGSEPPPPASPDNKPVDDDINRAHREMIIYQWQRVLGRLINTRNIDYEKQKKKALEIMYGAIYAYASLRGVNQVKTKDILISFIEERINENQTYKPEDSEVLTDLILKRIGGNHAFTET